MITLPAKPKGGGTSDIFEWNKRKALAHLLSMEEHCNELEEKDVPHSWCLVKHYLELTYHHVSEAITNAERLGIDVKPFRNFREKLFDLNIYPQPHITEKDVMALRTEWRKIIKDPTLESDCPLCSKDVTPEVLEEMKVEVKAQAHGREKGKSGKLLDIERKYTDDMLQALADKQGKPKPPFMIVDCGKNVDPSGRAVASVADDGRAFIAACAGGVNAHTLAHEANHVWEHNDRRCNLTKGDCPEDSAEKFALRGLSDSSNLNTHHFGGGSVKNTVATESHKKIIGIYGASIVEKATENYLLPYLDTALPTGFFGQPTHVWVEAVLGLGPALLVLWKPSFFKGYDLPVLVFSGQMTAKLIFDIITPLLGTTSVRQVTRNATGTPIYTSGVQVF